MAKNILCKKLSLFFCELYHAKKANSGKNFHLFNKLWWLCSFAVHFKRHIWVIKRKKICQDFFLDVEIASYGHLFYKVILNPLLILYLAKMCIYSLQKSCTLNQWQFQYRNVEIITCFFQIVSAYLILNCIFGWIDEEKWARGILMSPIWAMQTLWKELWREKKNDNEKGC